MPGISHLRVPWLRIGTKKSWRSILPCLPLHPETCLRNSNQKENHHTQVYKTLKPGRQLTDGGMGIPQHIHEHETDLPGAKARLYHLSHRISAKARSNSISKRIRHIFHRNYRQRRRVSAAALGASTVSHPSGNSAQESRPHTAPDRHRPFQEEERGQKGEADQMGKAGKILGADVTLSDAEIKTYLLAEHEKNMRMRLRGAAAKIQVDEDVSVSGSENRFSKSEYWSSRGSSGAFEIEPSAQMEEDHGNPEQEKMTDSENKNDVRTIAPMLKRKGNFHLERTLWALERTRTNSTDDMVVVEEAPMTPLRPPPPPSDSTPILRPPTPASPVRFPSHEFLVSPLYSSIHAPPSTPTANLAPPKRPRPQHKKSSSASSKISSYIGSSADLFDATRRDWQSSIRKNAEALSGRLPLDWREKIIDDDSDSDDSFYCIGENSEKRLEELDEKRRLGGKGEDPWTQGLGNVCRLCKKASPRALRGLCSECQEEFRRPRTRLLVDGGSEEREKKIKPPLPLRYRNPVSPVSPLTPTASDTFTEVQILEISKASVQSIQVDRNGPVKVTNSNEQSLQPSTPQDRDVSPESPTSFEKWQSAQVRAAYKRHEETYHRWSPTLLGEESPVVLTPTTSKFSDETVLLTPPTSKSSDAAMLTPTTSQASAQTVERTVDESRLPQTEKKRWKGKEVDRSESFYGFYDDILRDRDGIPPVPPERNWKFR